MRRSTTRVRRPWLLTVATLSSSPLLAQNGPFDCVIEAKATIELQSSEDGILNEILVTRGQHVKAGEVVARLESEQQALTAERAQIRAESNQGVAAAEAQAAYLANEAQRLRDLRATDSIPESQFASALVESELAEIAIKTAQMEHQIAQVDYAQARSSLERRSIRSPVDGVVVDLTMQPGEYVHEQVTVLTIAEMDPLYVETFMPVARYGSVLAGMQAEVQPEAPIGGLYTAEVAVVDNVFDAASRTFRVRLVLPNEGYALPAGLRCTVTFSAN